MGADQAGSGSACSRELARIKAGCVHTFSWRVEGEKHVAAVAGGVGSRIRTGASALLDLVHVAVGAVPGAGQTTGAVAGGNADRGGYGGVVEPGLQPVPLAAGRVGVGLHG